MGLRLMVVLCCVVLVHGEWHEELEEYCGISGDGG
jgi:hypothetical protein